MAIKDDIDEILNKKESPSVTPSFYDASNAMGNMTTTSGHIIHFVHVATLKTCHFKAFLTAWEDNFKQDWKTYETVGRMDPIKTYARTSRIINFSFDIPSADFEEAAHNLKEVQSLVQMSYPTFIENTTGGRPVISGQQAQAAAVQQKAEADKNRLLKEQKGIALANTISHMVSPPFLRLKFSNWLNDPSKDQEMTTNDAYGGRNGPGSGLYGTIENVKFSPDLSEAGGFYSGISFNKYNPSAAGLNTLVPKLLKLDITFNVLHTNALGYYSSNGEARTPDFPYNANNILNKIKVK